MSALRLIACISILLLGSCNSDDGPAPPAYKATRLTAIENAGMVASGINDNGDIAGVAGVSLGAVVYSNGTIRSLGTLPDYSSGAIAINNSGQAVGYLYSPLKRRGFLYTAGAMGELAGMTVAKGINNRGEIIGYLTTPPPPVERTRAFLYSAGAYIDLAPAIDNSEPYSLNDRGEVVGAYFPLSDHLRHPFLYSNGKLIDLGSRGTAYHINANGDVVGTLFKDENTSMITTGFLYSGGRMTEIDTRGGCCSSAARIDASGRIYGATRATPNGTATLFVLSDGKMHDLRSIVVSGLPAEETLLGIVDVNSRGQVLLNACAPPCPESHVYLLDPI